MTREQAIAQLRRERAEYTQNVALDMAIAALEREGEMEARLRWTMDTLEVALAETEGVWPTGGFEAYCAWIDSEIEKEASDD